MLRDFSDKSRVQLISLVNEVENGKSSNFTDWIADRWVDFLSWIGQLNTKGSLNTVNNYHRKVIDKNNATKKAINQIFDHVNSIDKTYSNNLKDIENLLKQWETYIDSLGEIVSPANGTFNVQYITYKMSNALKDIDEENVAFIRKYLTNETTVDRIYLTYLLEELANKMGKALINAVIYGDGANKPTGITKGLTAIKTGTTPIDNIINTYETLSDDARIGAKAYVSTSVKVKMISYKDENGNYPFLQGINGTDLFSIETDPYLKNNDVVVGNCKNYILNEVAPMSVAKESTVKGRKTTYGGYGIYDGKARPNYFAYGQYTPSV